MHTYNKQLLLDIHCCGKTLNHVPIRPWSGPRLCNGLIKAAIETMIAAEDTKVRVALWPRWRVCLFYPAPQWLICVWMCFSWIINLHQNLCAVSNPGSSILSLSKIWNTNFFLFYFSNPCCNHRKNNPHHFLSGGGSGRAQQGWATAGGA